MAVLQLQDISLAFGDRDILRSVQLSLSEKSRAALAGANGSGKTTLMKIIAGIMQADSGVITTSKDLRVSYLPQSGALIKAETVYTEADRAFQRFRDMERRLREIEAELSTVSQSASDYVDQLLHEHHMLQEQLYLHGYYERESMIFQVTKGLGFSMEDISRPCHEFSGGWQMRIALARILLERADILLLDEPTNYLDVEARVWLKNYLKGYPGGVLLVSHDRYFLDETVTEVHEVFLGSVTRYPGNYTSYEQRRELELQQLEKAYRLQTEEIVKIEQFIERFRYKASKAKQVQSRVTMLEKIERIQLPDHMSRMKLKFPQPPHSGRIVLDLNHVSRSYKDLHVIDGLSLIVNNGDRVAVTGVNGAGKSTLLRIMAGVDREFTGSFQLGAGVVTGYYAQNADETLDPALTALDELRKASNTSQEPLLRAYLGAFLFPGDDIFKQVSILSGGEKSRLALLKLLLRPSNLLILDEPTNHLDLASKDVLLEALTAYQGTLVFVSHDVDFIKQLATRIVHVTPGGYELFEGDYEYFSWKLEERNRVTDDSQDRRADRRAQKESLEGVPHETAANRFLEQDSTDTLDRKERNRLKNRLKTLRDREHTILHMIESHEQNHDDLLRAMASPEIYTDGSAMKGVRNDIETLEHETAELTGEWEVVASEIQLITLQLGIE